MRTPRRAAAVLAAVALLAAACGGGDTADDTATDDATTDGTATDDPATDDADATDTDAAGDEATEDHAAAGDAEPLTVYSGRSEELVGEVLAGFEEQTGIPLDVRYGDTAELAATILNEGEASPADVYFGQDAGALGALQAEGRFAALPDDLVELVEPAFSSTTGEWVGVTGRVRVLAYNTETLTEDEVPDSVLELTDPAWSGRVSWAPTNGSFQAFVTAMRVTEGEDVTREWLEGMLANDVQVFENNASQVEAVGRGEVDVALVNHYYLLRFTAEDPDFPVANKYLPGDIGGLVNVAGVGVLDSSDQPVEAEQFVAYLLSDDVQHYFGTETNEREFPAVEGVEATDLPTVEELDPPAIDLSDLEDLQGTLALLQETGALE
ncbi:iron ABC transporter substrate-binding protein [Egicoccus halophilus]|uniref:Iron ABC transporter substrate-binding protein n=1 Tax=Egicoccus halophilus TaxID=1670830 RepID=A0A8J3ADY0_9ACTN|nr:iron ABC transporter substrate-binding protein [Egicoccus halophilus]GGI05136.1 iron ABC transporter substrate-binding protein [Egicoccus halophilus]